MASFTLPTTGIFPDGTALSVFPAAAGAQGAVYSGTPVATATTSAGAATFTGLTAGTAYVAYAQLSGVDTVAHFTVQGSSSSSVGDTTAEASLALIATAAGAPADSTSTNSFIGLLKKLAGAVTGSTVSVDSTAAEGFLAGDGRKTVTTHGTALAIASSTACKWVVITAFAANTDKVAVGTSTVLAALGTQRGVVLAPGQAVTLPVDNLNKVYVDSRVDGEGVAFAYGV